MRLLHRNTAWRTVLMSALLVTPMLAAAQNQSLLEPLPSRGGAPGAVPSAAAAAPAAAAPGANQQLNQLFYQLQVLQQEVQELRGLVEEQSYQLSRLAKDQQEQYIDLDGRVASMTNAARAPQRPASAPTQASTPSTTPSSTPSTTTVVPAAVASTSDAERDTYTRAFDLMKARQFDESAAAFNQLIVSYPNGQYTANAFYWLGELYLAQNESEQARQSFAQVLNLYPDNPKVPDTLYKLGVAYHRLGDITRAETYFKQVVAEYPNSSAAGLASRYMAELQ